MSVYMYTYLVIKLIKSVYISDILHNITHVNHDIIMYYN